MLTPGSLEFSELGSTARNLATVLRNLYLLYTTVHTMAPSRSRSYIAAALLLTLVSPINALYFYMNSGTPKCFFEELPKDTLVVGTLDSARSSKQQSATDARRPNIDC